MPGRLACRPVSISNSNFIAHAGGAFASGLFLEFSTFLINLLTFVLLSRLN